VEVQPPDNIEENPIVADETELSRDGKRDRYCDGNDASAITFLAREDSR